MYHIVDIFFHRSGHKDLDGLNAKDYVAVTFHCIIPKLLWEWNEQSCIHMRFGHHALGNWEHNIGDFKQQRFVNFIKFRCFIKVVQLEVCISSTLFMSEMSLPSRFNVGIFYMILIGTYIKCREF